MYLLYHTKVESEVSLTAMLYRITGIFCGCLIFAVFCGSIEIAEIKNRKIFQSCYNDEIVSKVIVQSRILRCLSGIVVELSVYWDKHSYKMYTWT